MPAEPPAGEVKFLLVDDLDENLFALEALLRQDGLVLHKARSGLEALELLLLHDYDLALLDVQMEGMDGFELAELMRGTERTRRVPIIFLTAVATDERRHFRGYETGAVDFLFKPLNPQMLVSKSRVFFELAQQRLELARQRDELRSGAERLEGALGRLQAHADHSPLAVVGFDADFRVAEWSLGAERIFGRLRDGMIGHRPEELGWIHEADLHAFRDLQAALRDGEDRPVCKLRLRGQDDTVLDCEWYNSVLRTPRGGLASVHAQILDVTERTRAEATQKLLIGELNHRVKNMLATVQAIANQTLHHAEDPESFATDFAGRLQALARAHTLLSSSTWQGAMLGELIQEQLRIGTLDGSRLELSGPEVCLEPQMALHLGLILHELATNANKYGALTSPRGRLLLAWSLRGGMLRFRWQERGGPPALPPSRTGFGTLLIEQSAAAQGGEARVTYGTDGLSWDLVLPLPEGSTAAETSPVMQAPPPRAEEVPARPLQGRRFLIVEDEPVIAMQIAELLQHAGAEVAGVAATVEKALARIAAAPLDGALLDGNLRGESVGRVAAALQARGVPFVFVSGYGREGLPAGFGSVPTLTKPFTIDGLIKAAEGLLAKGAALECESIGEVADCPDRPPAT